MKVLFMGGSGTRLYPITKGFQNSYYLFMINR